MGGRHSRELGRQCGGGTSTGHGHSVRGCPGSGGPRHRPGRRADPGSGRPADGWDDDRGGDLHRLVGRRPAWTAQNDTCLTGAATSPPAGAAQIPTCAGHRVGPVPAIGATPGYLQLTDASGNARGSVLYNRPVPSTAGVSITLDQYQYGGNGADGIGFFLVDGSTNLTEAGAPGGSLGTPSATPSAASSAASSGSDWMRTATSTMTAKAAETAVRRGSAHPRRPVVRSRPTSSRSEVPGPESSDTATSPRPLRPYRRRTRTSRAPRSTAAPARCGRPR